MTQSSVPPSTQQGFPETEEEANDLFVDERSFFAEQAPKAAGLKRSAPFGKEGDKSAHYHGHRERLRARYRENGDTALADYEIL